MVPNNTERLAAWMRLAFHCKRYVCLHSEDSVQVESEDEPERLAVYGRGTSPAPKQASWSAQLLSATGAIFVALKPQPRVRLWWLLEARSPARFQAGPGSWTYVKPVPPITAGHARSCGGPTHLQGRGLSARAMVALFGQFWGCRCMRAQPHCDVSRRLLQLGSGDPACQKCHAWSPPARARECCCECNGWHCHEHASALAAAVACPTTAVAAIWFPNMLLGLMLLAVPTNSPAKPYL